MTGTDLAAAEARWRQEIEVSHLPPQIKERLLKYLKEASCTTTS